MSARQLDSGEKHMLRLIVKGRDATGWAKVSRAVYPLADKLPKELVELETVGDDGGGRIRLTEEGESVLDAMAWLTPSARASTRSKPCAPASASRKAADMTTPFKALRALVAAVDELDGWRSANLSLQLEEARAVLAEVERDAGDGGPAFPSPIEIGPRGDVIRHAEPGMSLRDYFAAKVMQAILSDGSWHGHVCETAARTAYEVADAMLKGRKQ